MLSAGQLNDENTSPRCMAIKFADHDTSSPFDLLCFTGDRCPYMSVDQLETTLEALQGEDGDRKKAAFETPAT